MPRGLQLLTMDLAFPGHSWQNQIVVPLSLARWSWSTPSFNRAATYCTCYVNLHRHVVPTEARTSHLEVPLACSGIQTPLCIILFVSRLYVPCDRRDVAASIEPPASPEAPLPSADVAQPVRSSHQSSRRDSPVNGMRGASSSS